MKEKLFYLMIFLKINILASNYDIPMIKIKDHDIMMMRHYFSCSHQEQRRIL